MLRITNLTTDDAETFILEGKLIGLWVDECRRAIAAAARERVVSLDLTHVTYVDPNGIRLLRDWIENGVRIVAQSNFVRELLNSEKVQ